MVVFKKKIGMVEIFEKRFLARSSVIDRKYTF